MVVVMVLMLVMSVVVMSMIAARMTMVMVLTRMLYHCAISLSCKIGEDEEMDETKLVASKIFWVKGSG